MFHSQCYGLRMDSAGHLCVSAHMDGKLRFWDLRQNAYDAISELQSHSAQCTGVGEREKHPGRKNRPLIVFLFHFPSFWRRPRDKP